MSVFFSKSSKFFKLMKSLVKSLPLNPNEWHRQYADYSKSKSVGYNRDRKRSCKPHNTPHPPKDPPENFVPIVVHKAFSGPEFLTYAIFRPFKCDDEILGPGATKCGEYKNPEYYAYHRYTFTEVQLNTLKLRNERVKNDGARCIYDYDVGNETELISQNFSSCSESSSSSSSDEESGKIGSYIPQPEIDKKLL